MALTNRRNTSTDFLANLQGGLIAFCPYIFVITTADNDNNNNNKPNIRS